MEIGVWAYMPTQREDHKVRAGRERSQILYIQNNIQAFGRYRGLQMNMHLNPSLTA